MIPLIFSAWSIGTRIAITTLSVVNLCGLDMYVDCVVLLLFAICFFIGWFYLLVGWLVGYFVIVWILVFDAVGGGESRSGPIDLSN
jgi:hypothetical protein